jgi:sulfate adenylyltransferase subunit 1
VYDNIRAEYAKIADVLGLKNVFFIPISALKGDNVVNPSENTPWYQGETLLHLLENIPLKQGADEAQFRFPVQYVIRPQTAEWPDYRAYAGRISGGRIKVGDKVTILPSQTESVVSRIDEGTNQVDEARSSQSVSISLADDVDVSRGSLIVKTNELPTVSNQIELLVCWLNHRPLQLRQKYIIRHTSDELQGVVGEVEYKVNINTLENNFDDKEVKMNDIAKIKLKLSKPLAFDLYAENRTTGSLVFIDEGTNETVGAGMIVG